MQNSAVFRRGRRLFAVLCLCLSGSITAAEAAEEPVAGEVITVLIGATRTPPGGKGSDLWKDYPVRRHDRLRTVADSGALHVELADGTELRLGAGAEVDLDDFVYRPDAGIGTLSASVGKGFARFVTGKLSGPTFKVRTPLALIGVRGTDFSVWVDPTRGDRTTVWVNDGQVEVTPLAGGDTALVETDAVVAVNPGGREVLRNVPRPAGDRGLGIGIRLSPPRDPLQ